MTAPQPLFNLVTMPPSFFLTMVLTLVGLPPGLPAALFLATADLIWLLVIDFAFDLGTHLGYFLLLLDADLRPQA